MSGLLSSQKDEENRKKILKGAYRVFRRRGASFTMNDLSKELSMSKKTIYTVFRNKESLLDALVDDFFDSVKRDEEEIFLDPSLAIEDKLRGVLGVMPESGEDLDFSGLYSLRERYGAVYSHIRDRIETGWEMTFRLLDEGIERGVFIPIDRTVFQLTFEAAVERFLSTGDLKKGRISYQKAFKELVDLLVRGIRA